MLAKQSYTSRWFDYIRAWDGTLYTDAKTPSYKTNHSSNFIYSSIESMRPILFDSNPRFEAVPVTPEAMPYVQDINTILDWEWHRTNMQEKLLANSIYTFALGTSIVMLTYEKSKSTDDEVDGEVTPITINPFNLYPDPLATCVEDAEYIIYANYFHVNQLKKKFPKKANELYGGDVKYSELVNDRDENAKFDNQVLVLEMWCRDYTTVDEKVETNFGITNTTTKFKYPRGRVITVAPEIGIVLEDKENPYKNGAFPFILFKDIDVPFQFWGEGEVKWLLSPQKQINDLYNQVIDNAKTTANAQWILDKNAGIPEGTLTNRPGLVIRKNPGTDVHRESPPSIPTYVQNMIEVLKNDVEVVSGIHDVTRGETPASIQSAAAIQALQEAAQTRIRLKVQLHENSLGQLGTMWVDRIKQFWKFNRVIPKEVDPYKATPEMQLNGIEMTPNMTGVKETQYEMLEVNPDTQLKQSYKIKIIGASTMQQSRASMLDQMIRLMQTPAEDGMPCVPREAVLDYVPDVNKRLILQHFDKVKREQMAQQQQQGMNNEMAQQMQMMGQQMQMLMQQVEMLQQKEQQRVEQQKMDDIKFQGYQQGMAEQKALTNQIDRMGKLPPELLDEIAQMDDEELGILLQEHPELLEMIQNEQNNSVGNSAEMR